MLDKYKEIRERLLRDISSLKDFCEARGSGKLTEKLKEVQDWRRRFCQEKWRGTFSRCYMARHSESVFAMAAPG